MALSVRCVFIRNDVLNHCEKMGVSFCIQEKLERLLLGESTKLEKERNRSRSLTLLELGLVPRTGLRGGNQSCESRYQSLAQV
jgi:hypothetical protein